MSFCHYIKKQVLCQTKNTFNNRKSLSKNICKIKSLSPNSILDIWDFEILELLPKRTIFVKNLPKKFYTNHPHSVKPKIQTNS